MSQEITIAGIGIAPEVLAAIVSRAASEVEGVASVGAHNLASNLVSMFSAKAPAPVEDVEAEVVDDRLRLTVHLTVFFGYPFKALAADVRKAVATAIDAQVGVEVAEVNICIDSLVFPKE